MNDRTCTDKDLVEWVKKQRHEYMVLKGGIEESSMTESRIYKLESIGFIWRVERCRVTVE